MRRYNADRVAPDVELIAEMKGKTFTRVVHGADSNNDDYIAFECAEGTFLMYHEQDCCEDVHIEDICGDLSDLENVLMLVAVECVNRPGDGICPDRGDESATWTFYSFSTIKGSVTIRWHGSSNGYYSESVDIVFYEKGTIEDAVSDRRDNE